MPKRILLIFLPGLLISGINKPLAAQSHYSDKGEIKIIQPRSVSELLELHKRYIEKVKYLDGYRIQIFNTNQLQNANKIKADFTTSYPDIRCIIQYLAPSYKLRVGMYQTKLAAYSDLQRVRRNYPDAFIVLDRIKLSSLP